MSELSFSYYLKYTDKEHQISCHSKYPSARHTWLLTPIEEKKENKRLHWIAATKTELAFIHSYFLALPFYATLVLLLGMCEN